MNSIAIWYERRAGAEAASPEIEIHVNHWKLKNRKSRFLQMAKWTASNVDVSGPVPLPRSFDKGPTLSSDHFMDIGLMIGSSNDVAQVCLFVPCEIDDLSGVFEDLGKKLQDDRILTAVFNEPYTISTVSKQKYFVVEGREKQLFNVYSLDVIHDVQVEKKYGGTILRFQFHHYNGLPTYYRFRLKCAFVQNLSFVYRPSNSLLESAFSSIEVVDFRINDTRDLDLSLIEQINDCGMFKINLVHYFVMRRVQDGYILSNDELHSVRQLEEKTWLSYINESEYKYSKTFAYHLKKKAVVIKTIDDQENGNTLPSKQYVSDFTAALKFRFENSRLFWYIVWFVLIAFAIELAANWLYDCLK